MNHLMIIAGMAALMVGCGNTRPEPARGDSREQARQGEVMKIRFERSGGFAGMMTSVDLDADSLPEAERRTLVGLVTDANFFSLPAKDQDTSSIGADRFNYRITIESEGRTHTVETTDGTAPATLVPLLDWLNGAARRARQPGGP